MRQRDHELAMQARRDLENGLCSTIDRLRKRLADAELVAEELALNQGLLGEYSVRAAAANTSWSFTLLGGIVTDDESVRRAIELMAADFRIVNKDRAEQERVREASYAASDAKKRLGIK